MRRFVLGWKTLGHETRLKAHIVNYADDFVICCRGTADKAMSAMRDMMAKLKLTVNEAKTRRCRVWNESFDFLGYTIGKCYSPVTGRAYIGTRPSRKKIVRLCRAIHAMTGRDMVWADVGGSDCATQPLAGRLGELLLPGTGEQGVPFGRSIRPSSAPSVVACEAQAPSGAEKSRFPDQYLEQQLGLVRLRAKTRTFPWANA